MAQQTLSTTSVGTDTGPVFSVNDTLQCRVAVPGDPLPTAAAPAFIRNVNQTGVLVLRKTPNTLFDYAGLTTASGTFFVNINAGRYELKYDSTVFGVLSASLTSVTPPSVDKSFYILKDAAGSAAFNADGTWASAKTADIHNTQWQFCIPIVSASTSSASLFAAPTPTPAPEPVPSVVASQPASASASAAPVITPQPAPAPAPALAAAPVPTAAPTATPTATPTPTPTATPTPTTTPSPAPAPPQNTDMTTIARESAFRVYIVGYKDGFEITRQTAKDLAIFFGDKLATTAQLNTAYNKGLSFCSPFIFADSVANMAGGFPIIRSIKTRIAACSTLPLSLQRINNNTAKVYYITLYGKPPTEANKDAIIFRGQKLTIHNFTPSKYSSGFTDYKRTFSAEMFEDMNGDIEDIDASQLPPTAMGPANAKGGPPPEPGAPPSKAPIKKTDTILLTVNAATPPPTPSKFTYDRSQGFMTNLTREFVHDLTGLVGIFGLTARNRAVV